MGTDFISIRDFSKKDIEGLFKKAGAMEKVLKASRRAETLSNRVVATLFFEPSTRTRLSFQVAATRLGAKVLDFGLLEATSVAKGETFTDTIRMIDGYADVLIVRHPLEGSARLAAQLAIHPVINAGDGGNQHPSQTLIDLYTIKKAKGKIAGLNVCLLGDLKHSRTMRSLLYGLSLFGAEINLAAPKGLEMDEDVVEEARDKFGAKIRKTSEMNLRDADVVYVCRIQKERFVDQYEAAKLQKEFRIDMEHLGGVKDDMIILHPLPKIDELDPRIDHTKHALYFEQARNGIPVRMAILTSALGRG
ncbi:MAG: aspartate carbamoyltransferase [Candidatus Micrarchaeota archaeon]